MIHKIAVLWLALLLTLPAWAAQEVRILIQRAAKVECAGTDLQLLGADGKAEISNTSMIKCATSHGALRCNNITLAGDHVTITSKGDIQVQQNRYHDIVEIWTQPHSSELLVIHPANLEDYVTGIVSSEVPRSFHPEVLKAQAITARTFAIWQKYRRLHLPYHLESSVSDQVFKGKGNQHSQAQQAVAATFGQVLTYEHRIAQAYFHSTCGNKTESALAAWGNAVPYLQSVSCNNCQMAPYFTWTYSMRKKDLERILSAQFNHPINDIKVQERTPSGRIKTALLVGKRNSKPIAFDLVRRLVGYTNIKSTWVSNIRVSGGNITFEGRGYGHGVGMCQWGAQGMAKKGALVADILAKYYPGTKVMRLY